MLTINKNRSLILQKLHHLMNNLLALSMPSIVDTTLLLRLPLIMRHLRQVPRIRVRSGRLNVVDVLNGGLLLSAHRLSRLVRVLPVGLLVLRVDRGVHIAIRDAVDILVANEVHPHLAVCCELALFTLGDCDSVADLLADQGWVDAFWDLVYGDVAPAATF